MLEFEEHEQEKEGEQKVITSEPFRRLNPNEAKRNKRKGRHSVKVTTGLPSGSMVKASRRRSAAKAQNCVKQRMLVEAKTIVWNRQTMLCVFDRNYRTKKDKKKEGAVLTHLYSWEAGSNFVQMSPQIIKVDKSKFDSVDVASRLQAPGSVQRFNRARPVEMQLIATLNFRQMT